MQKVHLGMHNCNRRYVPIKVITIITIIHNQSPVSSTSTIIDD